MTDTLRSARQLLAELQATQAYLRVAASKVLPYASVLAVERHAAEQCDTLLTKLGVDLGFVPFDTDAAIVDAGMQMARTPVMATRTVERPAAPPTSSPATRSSVTPMSTARRRTMDTQLSPEEEDIADAATAVGPPSMRARSRTPARRERVSASTLDQPTAPPLPIPEASSAPTVVEPDLEESVATSDATQVSALVQFDETPAGTERSHHDAETSEDLSDADTGAAASVRAAAVAGGGAAVRVATLSDVGSDALSNLDGSAPDIGGALEDADIEEMSEELSEELTPYAEPDDGSGGPIRYGNLTGRQGAQSNHPSPELGAARVATARAATSGLYGGATVPHIRPSTDERPRAAAIQLNPSGTGGRVLGLEDEEEPIAVGEADEEDLEGAEGGFSVSLQEEYSEDGAYSEEGEVEPVSDEHPPMAQAAVAVPPEPARPSPDEVAAVFSRAQSAAAAGDLQAGADLYSDVIDADPDHVPAHVARGRLYLDLGDYSRAMSDFMVAEEIASDSPEPQVAIGDLYFARKDYRKAIEYFNAALEMAPNHAMAFCRRGISHYYRKNYPDALEDLLRAQRIQPDIPNIMTYVSMAKKKARR
ncbi:MAG: tetratricopeptide repeat protein [Myxococcales bacterium]|nr:tetratricopeptide repeat protein [Myxococcales bacterium]